MGGVGGSRMYEKVFLTISSPWKIGRIIRDKMAEKETKSIDINWETHSSHVMEMMQGLLTSEFNKDVIIVCDDQKLLKAHQFVLKAFSPVFENILSDLPVS